MEDADIKSLTSQIKAGKRVAWVNGGTFYEIIGTHLFDDEYRGCFAGGRYIDLYNVDIADLVVFQPFTV